MSNILHRLWVAAELVDGAVQLLLFPEIIIEPMAESKCLCFTILLFKGGSTICKVGAKMGC